LQALVYQTFEKAIWFCLSKIFHKKDQNALVLVFL